MINGDAHADVVSSSSHGVRVAHLQAEVAYWKAQYERAIQPLHNPPVAVGRSPDRGFDRLFNPAKRARTEPISAGVSLLYALPDDVLKGCHAFDPSSNLCIASQRARNLLPRRHARTFPYHVTTENACEIVKSFLSGGNQDTTLEHISIRPVVVRDTRRRHGEAIFRILFALAPLMETLLSVEIDVRMDGRPECNQNTSGGIAQLRNCPHLHSLKLKLNGIGIGNRQAIQLSYLGQTPSLISLHLELRWNLIRVWGIRALVAGLRHSHSLRSLYLDLDRNARIDDPCLIELSTLMDAPSQLNMLGLNLGKPPTIYNHPNYRILDRLIENPRMVLPSLVTWGESSHESDSDDEEEVEDEHYSDEHDTESEESKEERYWWSTTGLVEIGPREFWEPGL
jgi:hypothetical protein